MKVCNPYEEILSNFDIALEEFLVNYECFYFKLKNFDEMLTKF